MSYCILFIVNLDVLYRFGNYIFFQFQSIHDTQCFYELFLYLVLGKWIRRFLRSILRAMTSRAHVVCAENVAHRISRSQEVEAVGNELYFDVA